MLREFRKGHMVHPDGLLDIIESTDPTLQEKTTPW